MSTLSLENPHLRLEINPEVGASPAAFEANWHGEWVPVMRPTPRPLPEKSSPYSSFTLAPYSNRIRGARFEFAGREYQLHPNKPEGNVVAGITIHGDVRNRPWQAERAGDTLICRFDSSEFPDSNWPWPFNMVQTYRLDGNTLVTQLELTNASDEEMPAGFGIHPYFMRTLPGSGDAMLQFRAKGYYLPDETLIPTEGMKPVPPKLDFSRPRSPGDQHIDTVFGGWEGTATLECPDSDLRMTIAADPIFSHFVVFTAPDGTLALEPVSNATDGFNLMAKGVRGTGVRILEPGGGLSGTIKMTIEGV